MKNRVYLLENGIIQIDVIGPQTAESVRAMGEEAFALVAQLRQAGRPVYVIDNLKNLGETTSQARHEVARIARQLDFDRGAMVGDSNPIMRYGTNLMLRAIGRPNLRYFASFEAAYLWIGVKPVNTKQPR